jgi:hypothetical protein
MVTPGRSRRRVASVWSARAGLRLVGRIPFMVLVVVARAAFIAFRSSWGWHEGSFLHQFGFSFLFFGLGYIGLAFFMLLRGTDQEPAFRQEPSTEGQAVRRSLTWRGHQEGDLQAL